MDTIHNAVQLKELCQLWHVWWRLIGCIDVRVLKQKPPTYTAIIK